MNLCAVILAAGRGKRMRSAKPKVLHELLGRPMLQHTVDTVKKLKPKKLVIVIGNGAGEVKDRIKDKSVSFVTQKKLLGTGNALLEAKKALRDTKGCTIIVLNGDSPLTTPATLKGFLNSHKRGGNDLSLLSFTDGSLSGYGRVLRGKQGNVISIVEDKHATADQRRKCGELNSGAYLMAPSIMKYLDKLKKHRLSGEFYLTDIVGLASKDGKKVRAYICPAEEVMGINNRAELHKATAILNNRTVSRLMQRGVTFIDPSSSIVHPSVRIGMDTVIYPNTCLEGSTSIGRDCVIYPGTRICDSTIGNSVLIKDNTLIESSEVGSGSSIGPSAHLRPQSSIGRNVKIGNFVEVKKSIIGDRTRASHLTYLGDAVIGSNVNIGAGTITCNYNGQKKHITTIESNVFVGSDSQFIAPVKIGRGAYIAAGATITRDVPAGTLAISRVDQKHLMDWIKTPAQKSGGKIKHKKKKPRGGKIADSS
ncbi:MAG TPA: UDP-N-acetylglucosamine diphosphorylase/glucosamine-1-phosphate N-acetyltransferase [Nitrospirae bacterium]|nr:bifunctional protein GlmU [bacterium BMS3Abin10]GBE38375.1 bifunctional protein GlmU [bacterium BMS3Bbin08]HDH50400.1 UDP-N-acetylglucosamine diphosphorylase/glucosamine-1-phosphate N-acetyltransferase [Nitrospirota bacterium]HDK41200.1 UDP-N-acetylglucosamine diphosphorylase/glucosamine-1-phosphate N-acetyltransferase [Nitrospirota bacterium]HDK82039.1 UDP-N-acetylglucosamine diphosphorylase/glucosamine-1-phosphate N-acetyltransferase [Nitrospirota bacterium]